MSQKTLTLSQMPMKANVSNIKTILHSMDVWDKRADKAHTSGDFSRATEYSNFVMELDALVAVYRGILPENY